MPRVRIALGAAFLFAVALALGPSPARATMVVLHDVTFADGGTASGYFDLNVYGYLQSIDITTTPGTSMGGKPIAGFTYTAGLVDNAVPFDTGFYFNSEAGGFSLALLADYNVNSVEVDPLILGSGSGVSLAGSYENCQLNATVCGGPGYLDGRLVTGGELLIAEPMTLSLLGASAVLLFVARRAGMINSGPRNA